MPISMTSINLQLVLILTVGFGFASILGYLTHKARLSPLLGYLFAGYLIGPYSPGFTADLKLAEQMAEIGVVLMMFGVGMHFKWLDLLSTAPVAVPGAILQVLAATIAGTTLMTGIGWPLEAGIIFGLAIGVASTVVLVRVLSDNHLLNTPEGHMAVGWLIVEDLITIAVLLLIEPLASASKGGTLDLLYLLKSFSLTMLNFILLAFFMFTLGRKIVSYIFAKVLLTKSHELFTLTILALTFVIATGSTLLLGTSIALGAFLAGLMIGQTQMRKQVSDNATSLKDAFVVIFFLSIGMLFNPSVIYERLPLFLTVLGIILVIKPLSAFLIARCLRCSLKTALTAALALAQIGEFSFILSEQALHYQLMPDDGYDLIVACSIVSIALNPLLFNLGLRHLTKKTNP